MLGNSWFKKEKPLPGLIGLGGGATSLQHGGAAAYMLEYVLFGDSPGTNTTGTISIPTDFSYTTVKVAGVAGGGSGGRSLIAGGGGGGGSGNIIGDEFPIPGHSITSLYYSVGYGAKATPHAAATDTFVKINGPGGSDLIRFAAGGSVTGDGQPTGDPQQGGAEGGPNSGGGPNGKAGGEGGDGWYDGYGPTPAINGGPSQGGGAGGGGGGGGTPSPTGPQGPLMNGRVGGYITGPDAVNAIESLGALQIGPAPQTWAFPGGHPGSPGPTGGWPGGAGGTGPDPGSSNPGTPMPYALGGDNAWGRGGGGGAGGGLYFTESEPTSPFYPHDEKSFGGGGGGGGGSWSYGGDGGRGILVVQIY